MNTLIITDFTKKNTLRSGSILLASVLLFSACSQQPAIPEAGGGSGANNSGASAANNTATNTGSNTQGANIGNGGGAQSTGSGGGYASGGKGTNNNAGNGDSAITAANLDNPNSLLSKRIIYFDYNLSSIKPQYKAILDAHTKLLAKTPSLNVRLEGHADERGTREYNVALSEERAKAVQWSMRSKGVKPSQVDVVAYGEERPAIVGDGEKSWAQNRRVEIKYLGR